MWLSVKMSLRQFFRRGPGVLFAFGAMAAAVALNAGAHSLIYSVLLQPLPYESPDRLAVVRHNISGQEGRFRRLSYEQFASLRERSTRWEHLEGFRNVVIRLQGEGIVESVSGEMISSEFFTLLGVLPRVGRVFTPREVLRGDRVAVISDAFYRSHLGGRQDILKTLYSTVRFSVESRMTEWGVRTALGASAADLLKQIVGKSVIVVVLGLLAGALLSLNLAGYLRSWLFELEPTNLVVLIAVSALILLTSLTASLVPARKALRLDVLKVINSD